MTRLLEEAFKKASILPEAEQNACAKWLLQELEDEKKWEKTFSESEDVLDQLADEAIEAHGKGRANPKIRRMSTVFRPDNEPYLGREALLTFDQEILFSLWVSSHIATYTQANRENLTDLQRAVCQIVPQGINLALSIRELIRQGYLFAALVLIRPLIERAAIISYIHDHPDAIEKWKNGWRFRERPSLSEMLHSMAQGAAEFEVTKDICEHWTKRLRRIATTR
ncbi:MAG: hypothetical protein JW955_13600 [Sedimentisphaerales bacterium]|nr:hypothetical protein [Sedimentisphaerales bacterium]